MFQRKIVIKLLIVILAGILILVLILNNDLWNFCGIRHIAILDEIQRYETTLEPELCESLIYKIDEFNEACDMEVEIIDCG